MAVLLVGEPAVVLGELDQLALARPMLCRRAEPLEELGERALQDARELVQPRRGQRGRAALVLVELLQADVDQLGERALSSSRLRSATRAGACRDGG